MTERGSRAERGSEALEACLEGFKSKSEELRGLFLRILADFPEIRVVSGRKFAFRPPKTIVIGPEEEFNSLLFLHEMGHLVSGRHSYQTDIERVKIEAEAWEEARELAEKYGVEWDEEFAQGELDSYRDWLHRRSKCPRCGLTRYQTPDKVYHCPKCENLG